MDTSVSEEAHAGGKDLTKGPIGAQLWSLAWPLMLSVFFYTLYNIVDAFWVGRISPEAIAAVSIAQIALFVMVALSMGITIGSGVLISMHIGAKEKPEAERVLGQSFVLAGIAGIFFTVISLVFRHEILTLSGATGLVFDPAMTYFVITAAGSILLFVLMTIMFAFNSQGDTFTLTKLFALSTVVNVVLDPLLIFGWYGFPELGIAGAAYATLISQAVFIVFALRLLAHPRRMIRFRLRNLTWRWESVKKVLNIGVPASLTQVINPIGLAALMLITSLAFMEPGAIAFSIGFRIEFIAFLPAIGFGFAAMAMIGQNLGAGNRARAREVFRRALLFSFLGAAAIGVAALLGARAVVGAFTDDPLVTRYALSYIWIIAGTYGFLAAAMVEASAFQAMGRSWPGFWIFFIRLVVIAIPLGYVLTHVMDMPITAMWAAIALGTVVSALVGYVWITRALKRMDVTEVPIHTTPSV